MHRRRAHAGARNSSMTDDTASGATKERYEEGSRNLRFMRAPDWNPPPIAQYDFGEAGLNRCGLDYGRRQGTGTAAVSLASS